GIGVGVVEAGSRRLEMRVVVLAAAIEEVNHADRATAVGERGAARGLVGGGKHGVARAEHALRGRLEVAAGARDLRKRQGARSVDAVTRRRQLAFRLAYLAFVVVIQEQRHAHEEAVAVIRAVTREPLVLNTGGYVPPPQRAREVPYPLRPAQPRLRGADVAARGPRAPRVRH